MKQTPRKIPDTNWANYGECDTCLVDAGRVCRHLTPRKGEGGLGHHGQRAIRRPHRGRPRIGK